jgi:glutamine synthetase
MDVHEAAAALKQLGVEYVFAQSVDMAGVPRAKLVPADHITDLVPPDGGAFFAGFAAYGMGRGPDEGDLAAIPDWDTLTVLPWRKNTARFASDVYSEGKPYKFCSRTILKNVREQARQQGYVLNMGVEPEFYLVRRTEKGVEPFDAADTLSRPCYDMRGLTRSLDYLQRLIGSMKELGWDVYATDHEDSNAQFEINFTYTECLTTCDRYVFFKYMAQMLAHEIGALACFMPKPWATRTGNGAHTHLSLWDAETERTNLFLDDRDPNGLSELAYQFIGGLLRHARAISALAAPTVNSYKRLIATPTISGATWAPVAVVYGGNNRTQLLRIPGPGRVENRSIDSACNIYLTTAAMLAAGLDGIKRKLNPGRRNDDNIYASSPEALREMGIDLLPTNLKEALEALREDDVIREALGQEFSDFYIELKMQEWHEYHNTVSQWEIDRYLTLV